MKRIGYYPGCSLRATAKEYDQSLRAVLGKLGVELVEIPDWSCCGATSAHVTQELLSIALPARNLAIAEEHGLEAILAPCAACFSRLAISRQRLLETPSLLAKVKDVIGRPFNNVVEVVNITEFLDKLVAPIGEAVVTPLSSAKLACYYGCLLVRPLGVSQGDDAEVPSSMERVVNVTGATALPWNMSLECCGGGLSFSRTGSVIRLGRAIIDDAREVGAQAVVVGCPMCHTNLDLRQKAMAQKVKDWKSMPVLFLSQVVGLSMGLTPKELGVGRHCVSVGPFLDKSGPEIAGALTEGTGGTTGHTESLGAGTKQEGGC